MILARGWRKIPPSDDSLPCFEGVGRHPDRGARDDKRHGRAYPDGGDETRTKREDHQAPARK